MGKTKLRNGRLPMRCLGVVLLFLFSFTGIASAQSAGIKFKIEPSEILLGRDVRAKIRIRVPLNTTMVTLKAASGKIDSISHNGAWVEATYLAPEEYFPQIDFVVGRISLGDRTVRKVWPIRLVGQGVAQIETEPGASARLRIGADVFGPVEADENGFAQVDVNVPPGIQFGIDDKGDKIDLGVPPLPRLVLLTEEEELFTAGFPIHAEMLVAVHNGKGNPARKGGAPLVQVNVGDTSMVEKVDDYLYAFKYSLSTRPEDDRIVFTIELPGSESLVKIFDLATMKDEKKQIEIAPVAGGTEPEVESNSAAGAVKHEAEQLFIGIGGGGIINSGDWLSWVVSIDLGWGMPMDRALIGIGVQTSLTRYEESGVEDTAMGDLDVSLVTVSVPIELMLFYRYEFLSWLAGVGSVNIGTTIVSNTMSYESSSLEAVEKKEQGANISFGGCVGAEFSAGAGHVFTNVGIRMMLLNDSLSLVNGNQLAGYAVAGYRIRFL